MQTNFEPCSFSSSSNSLKQPAPIFVMLLWMKSVFEGNGETRGADNGEHARDTSFLMDVESVGTVGIHPKGKKIYREKERVVNVRHHRVDDGGEACSSTEGLHSSDLREKVGVEFTNTNSEQFSAEGHSKRNEKLFFGGNVVSIHISSICLPFALEQGGWPEFCKIDFLPPQDKSLFCDMLTCYFFP